MKGKPIEPGCLAMVVGSRNKENNGRIVRVIRKLGEHEAFVPPEVMAARNGVPLRPHPKLFGMTRWLVESINGTLTYTFSIRYMLTGEEKNGGVHHVKARGIAQKRLIRIDGDEEQDTTNVDTIKPTEEVI
jgi:hypothetical protein